MSSELLAILFSIAFWISVALISSSLLQNVFYVLQMVSAFIALRSKPSESTESLLWTKMSEVALPIAVLVPAYNESATIVENIRSLLAIHYPTFEVIVINDGSHDDTVARAMAAFDMEPVHRSFERSVPHAVIRGLYGSSRYPNLLLIDKENGGKADALNAGINLSRAPLICAVDADSMLEADALLGVGQPFVDDPARMIAVGGTIRIVNGCTVHAGRVIKAGLPRKFLPLMQTIEYLRAFLMAQVAWSQMKALTNISGAFSVFRREVVVAVGGYSYGTVGEDMELIIKLHRYMIERNQDYAMRFIPESVCWTEAPSTWSVLARQRIRWQRGALEAFFKHRIMCLNPRYGRVGLLGFGHILIADVIGPLFEVTGYFLMPLFFGIGAVNIDFLLAFIALTFVFGIVISVGSLVLEELEVHRFPGLQPLLVLTAVAIIENFGYRQINNFWRVVGYWRYLRGTQGWGVMTRTGFRKA